MPSTHLWPMLLAVTINSLERFCEMDQPKKLESRVKQRFLFWLKSKQPIETKWRKTNKQNTTITKQKTTHPTKKQTKKSSPTPAKKKSPCPGDYVHCGWACPLCTCVSASLSHRALARGDAIPVSQGHLAASGGRHWSSQVRLLLVSSALRLGMLKTSSMNNTAPTTVAVPRSRNSALILLDSVNFLLVTTIIKLAKSS